MNWIELESEANLEKIISDSFLESNLSVAIFKHSTRCSISSMAKSRLSSRWDFKDELPIYHLDLIKYRELSNMLSDRFSIEHESPQILLIKEGKCVFDASHNSISVKAVKSYIESVS